MVEPTNPGWYPHPDDPGRLRHWSGWGWDLATRRRPEWVGHTRVFVARPFVAAPDGVAVVDGKVDLATLRSFCLPATAGSARLGATRAHPSGAPVVPGRPRPVAAVRAGQAPSVRVIHNPGPSRRMPIMASTAFLGVIALMVVALLGTTRSPLTTAGSDSFTHAANVDCAAAGARVVAAPGGVAAVEQANTALLALRTRLASLAAGTTEQGTVDGWLDGWQTFATERVDAATAAEHAGGAGVAATDAARAAQAETVADRFALTDDLGDCTLSASPAGGLRV